MPILTATNHDWLTRRITLRDERVEAQIISRKVFRGVQMTDVADIIIATVGQLARYKLINKRERRNEN